MEFRILSGEAQGAAIGLIPLKNYRVGSDFECDVYLPAPLGEGNEDSALPAVYFEFSLTPDNELIFNNIGCPLVGYPQKTKTNIEDNTPLEAPLLMEFLGLRCVVCPDLDDSDTWMRYLDAPPPSASKSQEALSEQILNNTQDEPTLSDAEQSVLQDIPKFDDSKKPNLFDRWFLKTTTRLRKIKSLETAIKKIEVFKLVYADAVLKNRRMMLAIALGLCVIIFVSIVYSLANTYSVDSNQEHQQQIADKITAIRNLELNLPAKYSQLRASPSISGKIVIEGVVKDNNDIEFIKKYFSAYKDYIEFKLITAAEAIKIINQIIQSLNLTTLTPQFNDTTYRLGLIGILQDMGLLTDLELAISTRLPAAGDVDTSQIYSLSEIETELNDILSKNGYDKRLTVTKDLPRGVVDITGYLTETEIAGLKAEISAFDEKYKALMHVTFNVKDALASLPIRISEVHAGGDFPYIVTQDGQKIYQGGGVDGVKVERITSKEIMFSGKFNLILRLDGESILSTAAPLQDEDSDEDNTSPDTSKVDPTKKDGSLPEPPSEIIILDKNNH